MNTFKIGDWVVLTDKAWSLANWEADGFEEGKPEEVTDVSSSNVTVRRGVSRLCILKEHVQLAKNPPAGKETKYKVIPFSAEAWKTWKGDERVKVFHHTNPISQFTMFNCDSEYVAAGVYEHLEGYRNLVKIHLSDFQNMKLQIPVTTKRIPFNPELKDAKVMYGDTELIDWHQMKSGVVCGTRELNDGFNGQDTNLYHPNSLTMEIEE